MSNMRDIDYIEENKKQYPDTYHLMKWITPGEAINATREREDLLVYLTNAGAIWGYDQTKIDCRHLSPGCQSCGNGTWSCLFMNGICNGKCFYCPTSQNEAGNPTTNTVEFHRVEDFLEYIHLFKFKGIGLSGGEPLLTLDRTLEFLSEIKLFHGDSIHVWLYTNGIKITEPILQQLKDAGLNEIRFDLGATNYNLEKIKLASKYIETITVEIPAVPDDYELLSRLLPEMKAAGVQFLNLHQLRCTPHNCRNLIERGYTFLHGPKVTVLESELTALKLIKYSIEHQIDLPINYCSFIYKNRYQGIAALRRHAPLIKKPFESITQLGLIRNVSIQGEPDAIQQLAETLKTNAGNPELWDLDKTRNRISLDNSLFSYIDPEKFSIHVNYFYAHIKPSISYMNPFKEIKFRSGKKFVIEKQPACPEIYIQGKADIETFKNSIHPQLAEYEQIDPGLMKYY